MYTPAVTIVAAWIKALTGVGPSIASGSHTCSGNCALLPHAPANSSRQIAVARQSPASVPAAAKTRLKSSVPNVVQIRKMPRAKPTSPMRFTKNAFLPAAAAAGFSYQKPINR